MPSKPFKFEVIISLAVAIAIIGLLATCASNRRSTFARILRSWAGETILEQNANNLAKDIRSIASMEGLQPWALATMARFQTGELRGDEGSHFFWTTNVFNLAADETPQFIKSEWMQVDQTGLQWPLISIVLSNNQPEYILITWDWGSWGIAVGPPDFRVPFAPQGLVDVKPGVYTYYLEK